jgi:hypothetical protein
MVERHGQASLCRRPGVRGAVPGLEEDLASAHSQPRWKSVAPRCRVIKWPVRAHFSILSPPTLAQPHRLESRSPGPHSHAPVKFSRGKPIFYPPQPPVVESRSRQGLSAPPPSLFPSDLPAFRAFGRCRSLPRSRKHPP